MPTRDQSTGIRCQRQDNVLSSLAGSTLLGNCATGIWCPLLVPLNMIKSAYLDTSVFRGYFDEEFSKPTVSFFERIVRDNIDLIVSEVLTSELENARTCQRLIESYSKQSNSVNWRKSGSCKIAKHYISEKVVGKTSYADCLHIALATLSHADILVSWNFKHIVNIDRIRGDNSVNLKLGYKMIEIYSPLELGTYE
jgi:hypothetical protein